MNVNLNYKGFGLYILGTAEFGSSVVLDNTYFWNTGTNSYSVKALDRYHPVTILVVHFLVLQQHLVPTHIEHLISGCLRQIGSDLGM